MPDYFFEFDGVQGEASETGEDKTKESSPSPSEREMEDKTAEIEDKNESLYENLMAQMKKWESNSSKK